MANLIQEFVSSIPPFFGWVAKSDLSTVGVDLPALAAQTERKSDNLAHKAVKVKTEAIATKQQAEKTYQKVVSDALVARDTTVAEQNLNISEANRDTAKAARLARIANRLDY